MGHIRQSRPDSGLGFQVVRAPGAPSPLGAHLAPIRPDLYWGGVAVWRYPGIGQPEPPNPTPERLMHSCWCVGVTLFHKSALHSFSDPCVGVTLFRVTLFQRSLSTSSSRLFSFTHLPFDSLGPPQGEARRKDHLISCFTGKKMFHSSWCGRALHSSWCVWPSASTIGAAALHLWRRVTTLHKCAAVPRRARI